MIRKIKRTALILFFASIAGNISAQSCDSCTWHITGNNATSYTVSTGQTLCVDSTGNYTGTIVLQGGTICNTGTINVSGITLTNGIVNNYNQFIINQDLTINTNIFFSNIGNGHLKVTGDLIFYAIKLYNEGRVTVTNDIELRAGLVRNIGHIKCHQLQRLSGGFINNQGFLSETISIPN